MNKEKEQSDKANEEDMMWEGGPVHPDQAKKEKHPRSEPRPPHTGIQKPEKPTSKKK